VQLVVLVVLIAQVFSIQFTVSYYDAQEDCTSGSPSFTATASDDGNCATANDNKDGSVLIVKDSNSNNIWNVNVYVDNNCVIPVFTKQMTGTDFSSCVTYRLPIINVLIGSIAVRRSFACFPEDSTMQLESGEQKLIQDLKVGDSVSSRYGFSEVYTFLDRRTEETALFNKFSFLNQNDEVQAVSMTPEHLILASREGQAAKFVLSSDVVVGDYIYHKNAAGVTVPVVVSQKESVEARGLYTPATLDGTVVVNGVVSSSYAIVSHEVSHMVLAPLRFLHRISPSLVPQTENGLNPYAAAVFNTFGSWVDSKDAFFAAPALATASQ